jgi:hypothetical protein
MIYYTPRYTYLMKNVSIYEESIPLALTYFFKLRTGISWLQYHFHFFKCGLKCTSMWKYSMLIQMSHIKHQKKIYALYFLYLSLYGKTK